MTASNEVRDNPARSRYELAIDGHIAFVDYKRTPERLVLVHTEVPKELGGRGVGSALARGVFEIVRNQGLRVEVRCDFLRSFLEKHPEYTSLVAS